MYSYRFKEFVLSKNHKSLAISIDGLPNGDILENFLYSDIQGTDGRLELEDIDSVLSGEKKQEGWFGNSSEIDVHPDKTVIRFLFPLEGQPDTCVVETQFFRDIIEIWVKKHREYKRTGKL